MKHLIFLLLFANFASADWPRFRGPNASGLADATLPAPIAKSHEIWSVELPGLGHGSPTIVGDRIFLLSAVAKQPAPAPATQKGNKKRRKGRAPVPQNWLTLCVDRKDGKLLWQQEFPERAFKGHRFNSAASSTAAADGERVVFAWGTEDRLTVLALSHSGETLWERDLGPVVGGHGFGGSPILYKDLVVLNNDQEGENDGNLIALDAATGKTRWTVKRRSLRISYSAPCVYDLGGREHLVFTNWQHGFTAVDPADGTVVAEKSVFFLGTNERAISSPIVSKDLVLGTCGFTTNPKHCVAMKLEGDSFKEVWRIEDHVAHIPCLLAIDDHTYMVEDNGILSCIETTTGKLAWKARLPDVQGKIFGSPVSDGKSIYVLDESGNLHCFAANSAEFASHGHLALGEVCRSTPAIVDNTLHVRGAKRLRAFTDSKQ